MQADAEGGTQGKPEALAGSRRPRHYCTYFDSRFLARGLALHASMLRHCEPFRLWILCLDEECHRILTDLKLRNVIVLRLSELERQAPDLAAVRTDRSTLEYYFTCTPALVLWLLERSSDIDILTYLDADLYFFSSPDVLFDELSRSSTLIVPHNLARRVTNKYAAGLYNVGWVSFRNDEAGLACLRWWRAACIESCVVDDDNYGDQKYLDEFPQRFCGVHVTRHPGVNLAPWNIEHYRLSVGADGVPRVDDQPVVFFHFSRLRRISRVLWGSMHRQYATAITPAVRSLLYEPYLIELTKLDKSLTRAARRRDAPLRFDRRVGERYPVITTLREIVALVRRGGAFWVFGGRIL